MTKLERAGQIGFVIWASVILSSFDIPISSFCRPSEAQAAIFPAHSCAEGLSEFADEIAHPFGIGTRRAFKSEPLHLHRNQSRIDQFATD